MVFSLIFSFYTFLSSCLLACIYPIVMRFYLIYFSVLVPLIFTVLNYSLGQEPTIIQNPTTVISAPSLNTNIGERSSPNDSNYEQIELRSPLVFNLLPSSTAPQQNSIGTKRKSLANHLYENMCIR